LIDPVPPEGPSVAKSIPGDLKNVWSKLRSDTKRISIFSYPGAPLRKWLEDLGAIGEDIDVLLTYGHAELLNLANEQPLQLPKNLQLLSLPFVSQDEYDWVLSQCDFNIVRGEDSFVRAQLAGKPFIWHIYPQEDRAHEVKLTAFLDLYLEDAAPKLRLAITAAMTWAMPSEWIHNLDTWHAHSQAWRSQLLQNQADGGLAARLLRFVA